MNKFVPLLIMFCYLLPIIANESFAYFGGDMIEQELTLHLGFDKISKQLLTSLQSTN